MQREEKSERSRRLVLDAALKLFASAGYRATTMREIADAAGVSTGNVYHHFPDKQTIFTTLVDEFIEISGQRRFPFRRAMVTGRFPDNLEQLGLGARDSIREFREYFILIYVDVIEFGGTHLQRFFTNMSQRLEEEMRADSANRISPKLRRDVSPGSALLLTARLFFSYFSQEILFNLTELDGKDATQIVNDMADILRNGMCE